MQIDNLTKADAIENFISSWLIQDAGVSSCEIRQDRQLTEYGLDSLLAVQLSGRLEDLLGRPLSPSLAWEFNTIAELAAHLAEGGSGTQDDLDA